MRSSTTAIIKHNILHSDGTNCIPDLRYGLEACLLLKVDLTSVDLLFAF